MNQKRRRVEIDTVNDSKKICGKEVKEKKLNRGEFNVQQA
jgi:hypothetical protein